MLHLDRPDLQRRNPADAASTHQDDARDQSLDALTKLPVPPDEFVEGFVGGQFSQFSGQDVSTAHNHYPSSLKSGPRI